MQAVTRFLTGLSLFFATALPVTSQESQAVATPTLSPEVRAQLAQERPRLRPAVIASALSAARGGAWARAQEIARADGPVSASIIEWMRLRAGQGSYSDVRSFLDKFSDWPGEAFLRKRSEPVVIRQSDNEVLAFFTEMAPQTPRGVLAQAAALTRADQLGEAQVNLVLAWRTMPMNPASQALFLAEHDALLKPHHTARLDAMIWQREHDEARQMFDLVSKDAVALAKARIALQRRAGNVNSLINALPKSVEDDPGLAHARFEWRIRNGNVGDAKKLLLERSTSVEALGQPARWSNRRRALARGEMRSGNRERAYRMASQHFLEGGSDYADLEWLSGYIALRFLKDPQTAYQHFLNHDSAVASPISQGRAGYWQGRALEDMNDPEAASVAYREGAKYQTSFYGLLAAEKANVPFDETLKGVAPEQDWRSAPLAQDPLFQAGLLLQQAGERNMAERFWTHLTEQLVPEDIALLGQAAIDLQEPHLAVMIGKRAARRGLTIAAPYYALHPLATRDLPMAPEMNLAIARRESEFDPVVQSSVGARGLMQLMPATAREVASQLGVRALHSTERLTADPVYNAQLGAKYLSNMARQFNGNVVMMSAAYNAGPSRPIRWMKTYGDPRNGAIDIVDFVEMVPFRETQNYIMRVTESLPIYRARLGKDPLPVPFSEELIGSTLKAFAPKSE